MPTQHSTFMNRGKKFRIGVVGHKKKQCGDHHAAFGSSSKSSGATTTITAISISTTTTTTTTTTTATTATTTTSTLNTSSSSSTSTSATALRFVWLLVCFPPCSSLSSSPDCFRNLMQGFRNNLLFASWFRRIQVETRAADQKHNT